MPLAHVVLLVVSGTLMVVLSVYSFHAFLMIVLYYRTRGTPVSPPPAPARWPAVTVQLPIFNEPYVVSRLIDAACDLDYPRDRLDIQVLDDSTDETSAIARALVERYRAAGIDITYIHRTDRTGFKAGALKAGLETAKGEFLAFFDADFVPPRDFLTKMVRPFADPSVAVTQARWGHLNGNFSLLTKVVAIGLDAHFVLEHGARNASGLFINFNGTAGVWRKTAIIDAGNWQADTLTEDVDISYRAQLAGWKCVYVNDVVCNGEIPAEAHGLKTQQYRWSKGTIQTAKKLVPRIWAQRHLPFLVKWEATTHLTNHIVFPVMLILSVLLWPLMHLRMTQQLAQTYFLVASVFTVFAFSYPLFYAYAQKELYADWKRRVLLLPLFMAAAVGMSLNNTKAVISALLKRKSAFMRTPKYRLNNDRTRRPGGRTPTVIDVTAMLELALAAYCFAGVWYASTNGLLATAPFMLLPAIGFAWMGGLSVWESLGRREATRVGRPLTTPSLKSSVAR